MKYVIAGALFVFGLMVAEDHVVSDAHAQSATGTGQTSKARSSARATEWKLRRDINQGVVRIVSGRLPTTAFRATAELASIIQGEKGQRLLPIMGQGSIQNIADVLYLKGVDLAVVQADVLDFVKERRLHSAIDRRLTYISKLYNEEVHILAGPQYDNIKQLAGKKVAVGLKNDGAFVTASNIFQQNKVVVEPVFTEPDVALEMLKSGQIAAMVYVEGKPADLIQRIKKDEGLKFLPVAMEGTLATSYLPSRLTAEEYPNLVAKDKPVSTIATGAVMVSFNWKQDTRRYEAIAKMIDTVFTKFPSLMKKPYHPKWKEVNLAAQVRGWNRHPAVESAIAQTATASAAHACSIPELRLAMQKFFDQGSVIIPAGGKPTPQQTEQLVQEFKRWLETQSQ